jgi:hypothetical protein
MEYPNRLAVDVDLLGENLRNYPEFCVNGPLRDSGSILGFCFQI